jgi:methylglyoxal synthase
MNKYQIAIRHSKKIALVADSHKTRNLVEWAKYNQDILAYHTIYATNFAGTLLEQELGSPIHKLESGLLSGNQQIGSKIVDGDIDFLVLFWNPLESISHAPEIEALLQLALVWNIPTACNRATADFIISSPLMHEEYNRLLTEYNADRNRMMVENAY